MIRVLIVDDEKLVRQGIISSLPWESFGMEIVGEAKNGEKALEFLEQHEVDLMLTDLAMPVMSGIELMRVVRKRYPALYVIVLTLHQDFEYIQEALRIGAIDYIAKVELVQEQFGEILGRIHDRIQLEMQKGLIPPLSSAEAPFRRDRGYVLLPAGRQAGTGWIRELDLGGKLWEDPASRLWILSPDDAGDNGETAESLKAAVLAKPEWLLLGLEGLAGLDHPAVCRLLAPCREALIFYEFRPGEHFISRSVQELEELSSAAVQEGGEDSGPWPSFGWIQDEGLFEAGLADLKARRLPELRLMRLLLKMTDECNAVFGAVLPEKLELPAEFKSWSGVEAWLRQVRQSMGGLLSAPHYSQEVHDAVLRAMEWVQKHLDEPLYAAEIAKQVNVSRSYFSQCFKDICGKTFNEYVRQARVDKAKEYLIHTSMPILWIAEKTGYLDGKYFSTVFREQTGYLPSAFRKKYRRRNGE